MSCVLILESETNTWQVASSALCVRQFAVIVFIAVLRHGFVILAIVLFHLIFFF